MSAINPPVVHEQARKTFLQLLRARYWSEEEREYAQIEPSSVLEASDVIDELAEEPLRLFRPVWDDLLIEHAAKYDGWQDGQPLFEGVPIFSKLTFEGRPISAGDPRLQPFHDSVLEWTKRWHLEAEWCLERAFETLTHWCEWPEELSRRQWAPTFRTTLISPVNFTIDQWDGSQPLSKYKASGNAELKRQFDIYVKALTEKAEERKVPTILDRHGPAAYCWVVQSQVLSQTHDEIARESLVSKGNVDEAVRTLLIHLGLPPRPKRRGRKLGSKDRTPRKRRSQ